jgi:hypothetical protein
MRRRAEMDRLRREQEEELERMRMFNQVEVFRRFLYFLID